MNINEQANFIWSIADLLRGDFKQSEYGKVILPFIKEYEAQTKRFDFDSFDERFYDNEDFHQQVIDYFRCNVEQVLKN